MELTTQQNHFKIELKRLEDDLLNRLSAAHGHFLGDISLVEQLENTKTTAAHIQHKVRLLHQTGTPLCCLTVVKCMCFFLFFLSTQVFLNVTQQAPHFIALAANDVQLQICVMRVLEHD